MFGAIFALALVAAVAFATATGAQSASGSCVRASSPHVSRSTLYAKARHSCSGSDQMYAFIQVRKRHESHVYTLGSGSTTGNYLKIGASRCPYAGKWRAWTLVNRGLATATSRVVNYSCSTNTRRKR